MKDEGLVEGEWFDLEKGRKVMLAPEVRVEMDVERTLLFAGEAWVIASAEEEG